MYCWSHSHTNTGTYMSNLCTNKVNKVHKLYMYKKQTTKNKKGNTQVDRGAGLKKKSVD